MAQNTCSPARKADGLFCLSKESVKRRLLDDLWKAKAATAPRSMMAVLASEPVLDAIRKEIRRQTGYQGDVTEIRRVLLAEIVRPDLV